MTPPPRHLLRAALRPTRGEDGVAMVEFALVLPVLMLILVGVLDFGKAFNYWIDETHLANEAARFAVANNNPSTSGTLASYVKAQADTAELRGGLSICIAGGTGASTPPLVGDPITATATYTYTWFPIIGSIVGATKTITATATMRAEAPIAASILGCA